MTENSLHYFVIMLDLPLVEIDIPAGRDEEEYVAITAERHPNWIVLAGKIDTTLE